jgi:ABC-type nickel/cobalt efflux system permease component RcnA
MKSKVIIIVFSILLLAGLVVWGIKKSHNHAHNPETCTEHDHSNTHTHADGTVHSDHAPEQESFKVEADTVKQAQEQPRPHSHNGQSHTH